MRTGDDVMRAIVEDLTPPVDPDRDHWRGGEHAAVTLVEYGDYECPRHYRNINEAHCRHFEAMDVPLGSVGVAASA
jgi:hypothetical protein